MFQSGGWIGGNADINSPILKTSDGINEKSLGRHTSVIPEGLEPPTNRTGICHSIQLNYGTKPKNVFVIVEPESVIPRLTAGQARLTTAGRQVSS